MIKFDVQNLKDTLNEGKNSGFLTGLFNANEQVSNKTAENLMNNMKNGNLSLEVSNAIREMGATAYEDQIKNDIARLLKNMNGVASRRDILTSIGNNLTYLATALAPHKSLAEQLRNLAEWFKYPNQEFDFSKLKQLVNQCTSQAEKSVLYNDKVAKNISILQYNFSRFMETTEGLEKATENMFKYLLDEQDMIEFRDRVYKEVIAMSNKDGKESTSKVMTTICKLIEKQVENSTLTNLNSEKIEKIVYSLLSSPTKFTPLLHYVIPVEYMNMRAFAEVWIDPLCEGDEDENGNKGSKSDLTQVLVAFDIDRLGRFETEIMVNKNKMSAYIYVPDDILPGAAPMAARL